MPIIDSLQKISDTVWELPPSYKEGMGACHLRRPDVRAEVERCVLHFDRERYDIDAFVLMPNHVHAVIKPAASHELSRLLQAIKGGSAKRCNKLLSKTVNN